MRLNKPFIFIFCITVIFFVQNYYVPFFSDDLSWVNSLNGDTLADNISRFFERQREHWLTQNGRFTCHAVLQILAGNGEIVYDVAISCLLFLLIVAIALLIDKKIQIWVCSLAVLSLLYLSPASTSNFYWAAGGCNYLLSAFLSCAYLLLLRHGMTRHFSTWQLPLVFLFSLLAGWSHEIFALPISFAIFCFVIYRFVKERSFNVSLQLLVLIVPFWIGAILIVVSPGTLDRIAGNGGATDAPLLSIIMSKAVTSFKIFRYGRCFYLLLALIAYMIFSKTESLRNFLESNAFVALSFLGSLGIVVILGVGGRAIFGVEILSLILVLSWINEKVHRNESLLLANRLGGTLALLLVFHQVLLVIPFKESWNTYRDVEAQTRQPGFNGTAKMEDWHSEKWWIDSFVAHPYEMMMEDIWMRMPLHANVCRSDQYKQLDKSLSWNDSNIAENIGGDYYIPYSVETEQKIQTGDFIMELAPMSYQQSGSWLYLSWHMLIQGIWSERYPNTLNSIYPEEYCKIQVGDKIFIRFDKPVRPVCRQIIGVKMIE